MSKVVQDRTSCGFLYYSEIRFSHDDTPGGACYLVHGFGVDSRLTIGNREG